MSERPEVSNLRADIGAKLEEHLTSEQLDQLMTQVLAITKTARGWCPKCSGHVHVEIPDAKAVVGAMADLANQSFGRPDVGRSEATIVNFTRKIVYNGSGPDAA